MNRYNAGEIEKGKRKRMSAKAGRKTPRFIHTSDLLCSDNRPDRSRPKRERGRQRKREQTVLKFVKEC